MYYTHKMYIIGYTMKWRFIRRFIITEATCTLGILSMKHEGIYIDIKVFMPHSQITFMIVGMKKTLWACYVAFAALSGSTVALFVSDM